MNPIRRYGLIGFPLDHSYSASYFKNKFDREGIADATFELFPISDIGLLPELLQSIPELHGLAVTIPYKQLVIPYLRDLDDVAAQIGAVNCIRIVEGKTTGFNTDAIGFEQSLIPLLHSQPISALVLGTGGAARMAGFVLGKIGIHHKFISRTAKPESNCISYNDVTPVLIKQYKLIVNCTPIGMFPAVNGLPQLPYQSCTSEHIFYDMVYNPGQTLFLSEGEKRGATTKNGLEMLQIQAELNWKIWNNQL